MLAQACASPNGSRLSSAIMSSPMFIDQKPILIGRSRHSRPGMRDRTQKSMSPMPSIP